jgi:soluble calcium-activated nucleotidase 1
MIFESCAWSSLEAKWFFLPRRASQQKYDEDLDEKRATNLLVEADETFENVEYKRVGQIIPVRGYSSFKFVPNTRDRLILALKSEEDEGKTRTYVTLIDRIAGHVLVPDLLISDDLKYEGIEFV